VPDIDDWPRHYAVKHVVSDLRRLNDTAIDCPAGATAMNRFEKGFVILYWAFVLVSLPYYSAATTVFSTIGIVMGFVVLLIVFGDLYKRDFPDPNVKVTWAILFLLFWPSTLIYLCKYGFQPR
jgi:hypothetical protein